MRPGVRGVTLPTDVTIAAVALMSSFPAQAMILAVGVAVSRVVADPTSSVETDSVSG